VMIVFAESYCNWWWMVEWLVGWLVAWWLGCLVDWLMSVFLLIFLGGNMCSWDVTILVGGVLIGFASSKRQRGVEPSWAEGDIIKELWLIMRPGGFTLSGLSVIMNSQFEPQPAQVFPEFVKCQLWSSWGHRHPKVIVVCPAHHLLQRQNMIRHDKTIWCKVL
jgi:hypothetical protein